MEDWKKIEAILFASGKYLTEEQLAVLSGIPKNKIKKVLAQFKEKYETADTSLAAYNEMDAWKLNVKEEYTDVIREVVSEAEMPRAVMETLAIIAYKSPVLQSEIKDIRGASVYEHIPLLEAKGFIVREKHGRSFKIKLTTKFHEYFDIDGDSKLIEMFKNVKKPEKIEKLGTLEVYTEEESDANFDQQILERMKKLEKTDEDQKHEDKFLNDFEEKFEKTKKNIDESEQDIQTFRKKADEDTEQIFQDRPRSQNQEDQEEERNVDSEDTEQEKNQEEQNVIDDDIKKVKDEGFDEQIDDEDAGEESDENTDEESDETSKSKQDIPEFLKKVNDQIDELINNKDK